jgi:hypothetical protein
VKQNLSQKELLAKATVKYAENIHLAEDYLASRGITREVARLARLGVVAEPEVGHEAIPRTIIHTVYYQDWRCRPAFSQS